MRIPRIRKDNGPLVFAAENIVPLIAGKPNSDYTFALLTGWINADASAITFVAQMADDLAAHVAGMVFVSGIPQSGFAGMRELKGILLGLGAATFYAIVVILNQYIKDISAYDKTIMQLGTAAVALLPYTLLTENFADITFTPVSIIMLIFVGRIALSLFSITYSAHA